MENIGIIARHCHFLFWAWAGEAFTAEMSCSDKPVGHLFPQ